MVEFLSSWAEQIVIAIVIATIIEMILPQNKNKKYVKMVIGLYILFSILSPWIKNPNILSVEELDQKNLEKYAMSTETTQTVDQSSMDQRIQKLYLEELEKDIKTKVGDQGYTVTNCKVNANLEDNAQNQGIQKIEIAIRKKENSESQKAEGGIGQVNQVEIKVGVNQYLSKNNEKQEQNSISNQEVIKVKEFLSQTYEIEQKNIVVIKE